MKVHCETTEISPAVVQFSRLLAIFCGFEFSPCFWNDSRRRFPRQNPWSNYGGFELSDWYISKKKAGEDFGIVLECLGFGWRLDRVSPLRKRRGSGDSPGLQNRRLAPCGVNGAFDSHTLPPIFSATCKLPHITADLASSAPVACWLHKSSKAFIAAVASAGTDFT